MTLEVGDEEVLSEEPRSYERERIGYLILDNNESDVRNDTSWGMILASATSAVNPNARLTVEAG